MAWYSSARTSCGLVMNKDEIQHELSAQVTAASCGLVMNKDEIQPFGFSIHSPHSCGLVMNKDEIQRGPRRLTL